MKTTGTAPPSGPLLLDQQVCLSKGAQVDPFSYRRIESLLELLRVGRQEGPLELYCHERHTHTKCLFPLCRMAGVVFSKAPAVTQVTLYALACSMEIGLD